MESCKVALADDHALIRNGLAGIINTFAGYEVILQANNGKELIQKLNFKSLPDIVLLDVNMPQKDGFETALWLKIQYPEIRVLALSMYDTETAIIHMIRNGARGYILKDAEPSELKAALNSIKQKGFHYSELVTGHLINTVNKIDQNKKIKNPLTLSEREVEFLKYTTTELSYKQIAEKMCLSPRTIDGYRDNLFERLQIKSRVGLVMYAIKNSIISVEHKVDL